MRIAILSDIHGNREALAAVLADPAFAGAGRVVILGDIVGYGPDPGWCVDVAQRLVAEGAICVRGNHDHAIAHADPAMSPLARAVIDWTRPRLTAAQRDFLAGLPMTAALDDLLFVHASADHPEDWIYVTAENRAMAAFRGCTARLLFCGHTHRPALWSQDRGGRVAGQRWQPGLPVPLLASRRWLAVVGAVGQPRDGAVQAAWALLDTERAELTFRRTRYDVAATAAKLRAAGLDEALARRLTLGR